MPEDHAYSLILLLTRCSLFCCSSASLLSFSTSLDSGTLVPDRDSVSKTSTKIFRTPTHFQQPLHLLTLQTHTYWLGGSSAARHPRDTSRQLHFVVLFVVFLPSKFLTFAFECALSDTPSYCTVAVISKRLFRREGQSFTERPETGSICLYHINNQLTPAVLCFSSSVRICRTLSSRSFGIFSSFDFSHGNSS